MAVDGQPDDPARRLSNELCPRREEPGMRPAIAHRHAEPLRVADDDVGSQLPRRCQQRQGQQIAADHHQGARLVGAVDQIADGDDRAILRRVLQHQPEDPLVDGHHRRVPDLHLDSKRTSATGDHVDRLRETAAGDQQPVGGGCRARP